ncbi:MAG: magnesium transporter CorA [Saprospiraceae bacterium]|nr:magnesium transporter CorA [Saprospiraceae bacterium]
MPDQFQLEKNFKTFIWTDICIPNQDSLEGIAKKYSLDYFQIRDSLEQGHLPKIEKLAEYNFLILRAFTANIETGATTINDLSNKIAFFYDDTKIITIHRSNFSFIYNIQKDFNTTEDLLLYLIHKMLETYQAPLNDLDNQIEEFEKSIFLSNYSKVLLEDLYYLKSQTRITKKLLLLIQNVIQQLEVKPYNKTALQDIKDKLLSLLLNYDEVFENAHNLLNSYHSVNAQKSNDVMKLLTIFSAFFLPLTFIAGIYGMNFDNMPELKWTIGYYITLGIMILVSVVIFFWFKRKKIL